MQTAVINGKIFQAKGQFAEALLIENGVIPAAGTTAEILRIAGNACETIDLAGRTAVPGFNDSHLHLANVGFTLMSVRLGACASMEEVIAQGKAFIDKHSPAPGSTILGRGWNQDYFTDTNRMPNRHDLDKISTEHSVVFTRACGHVTCANTYALEKAGIGTGTAQVDGGEFELGEDGFPNGIFKENAAGLLDALRPPRTGEALEKAILMAMEHAAENGITSVQTNDIHGLAELTVWEAYQALCDKGLSTLRVYHQCNLPDPAELEEFASKGFVTGFGDGMNKIGPLKLFIDGSLGARTCLMRKDFHDAPGVRGIQCLTEDELDCLFAIAAKHNMQIAVHAIGDGGIELVLNAYKKLNKSGNPLRHGIIHCQITDRPLLERFAEQDILAYIQPIFLHYDMHVVESRAGAELASTSYAFRTMEKLGVHTSFGSDSPVEDLNTMENIYCAVTRQDLKGYPSEGFYPEECVTVEDAVIHYTYDGAYASFEEDVKGRLLPGYCGDLSVLSEDIFTIPPQRIKDVKVMTTILGGSVVYRRK